MKLHKLTNLFKRAHKIAELSPDAETKVGCIAVRDDLSELGSSYNGFIREADDDVLPKTRPQKYEAMIHAEQNLVTTCAKHQGGLNGTTVICTLSPCISCCRLLWQAGIKTIYFEEEYRDFQKQLNMPDLKLNLTLIGPYTKIELETK